MKRKSIKWIFGIIVLLGLLYVLTDKSEPVNKTFEGISYYLGEDKLISSSHLELSIVLRHNILGHYWADGKVIIDEKVCQINFDGQSQGNFITFTNEGGDVSTFGEIYMNNDASEVTIAVFDSNGWSSGDGHMLTYPANTREEGIEISNRLMADWYESMGIKPVD